MRIPDRPHFFEFSVPSWVIDRLVNYYPFLLFANFENAGVQCCMIKGIVEYVLCCSQWKLITVGEIRSQSSVSIMLEYRWFPPKDGVYHKRLKSFLKENSCLHALPLKCDTFFNFHTVKAELFHKESRESARNQEGNRSR